MQAIERFTRQDIPVQIIPEFMPDPGEQAEPIAMGRQTIWGGAGRPPSRDVMLAAGRAARTEMMQRVRESKGAPGGRAGRSARPPASRGASDAGQRSGAPRSYSPANDEQPPSGASQRTAQGRTRNDGGNGGSFGGGYGGGDAPARSSQGQPDPMRTSVDMMAERGARRGGRSGGGGYAGGNRGGGAGGRSGGSGGFTGGGNSSRGPAGSRGSLNR